MANLVIAGIDGDPAGQTVDDVARALACAARVVESDGSIVLLTSARPEIGASLERAREFPGPAAALAALHGHPLADYSAAYQWLRAAERARVYLLSQLPNEQAEELFVTPLENTSQVQRLVDRAESCLVLPDAHRLLVEIAAED
jgi:hypothetical protein